ncbi:MFS transporter [Salinicola avicenniae]|uniref:MFS transporter n=1 Tax=Salinicola avicenniae TaxID=2916836 RepID=UPI002072FCDD|nr:MFS transporter [Salinicola sp. S1-1-8]
MTTAATETTPSTPWPTIVLLALTAFCAAATQRILDPMLPKVAEVYTTSLAAASWAITAFAIVYGCLQLVLGPSGDRYGKLRVIALFSLLAAVASLLCALSGSLATLIAARMLAGVGCAAVIPLAMAWIGDNVPYAQRQAVLARFLIGQICGLACGQTFGGLAAEQTWWQWPFLAYTLLFALASGLLWLRAARHERPKGRRDESLAVSLRAVLSQPWPRVVLMAVFCEGAVVFCGFAFVASHLHVVGHLPLAQAGMILAVFALGGLSFALLARQLVPRLGEAGLCRIGGMMIATAIAAIALRPTPLVAIIGCYLFGLGFYMLHNTLQTTATQMAPERRGAAVSLFATAFFTGQSLGTAVGGAIIGFYGTTPTLGLAAVGVLPVAFGFAAQVRRRQKTMAAEVAG